MKPLQVSLFPCPCFMKLTCIENCFVSNLGNFIFHGLKIIEESFLGTGDFILFARGCSGKTIQFIL